jgi:hypothetical protein
MIQEYVEDSIIEVNNLAGSSISSSSIDTKYQSILTDMGAIKVLRYMIQPNFSLGGELNISCSETLSLIKDMEKKVSTDLSKVSSSAGVQTTEPELNFP